MSKYSVKNLINTELTSRSKEVRLKAIEISKANGGYHYGGSFSSAEILLTIYDKLITDEDRFILSKGHTKSCWKSMSFTTSRPVDTIKQI